MNKPSHISFRVVSWALFGAWTATIYYLSSLPADDLGDLMWKIPGMDKIAHFFAFAAGAVLLAAALWLSTQLPEPWILVITIIAISLYGGIDEWHQLSTPNRSGASVGDWLADTLGASVGAFALRAIYERYRHRKGERSGRATATRD